ncbi:MAG: crossover junction endodeoxyribonuclease RuvC [Planctomycetota bacterium]
MAVMRILGIDPGTRVVGYACLELSRPSVAKMAVGDQPLAKRAANLVQRRAVAGRVKLLEAGSLELGSPATALSERLHRLSTELDTLIGRFSPAELALEEAFFGKSVQSALRIGESRGAVLAVAGRHGLGVHQFSPAKIKRRITGRGSASKEAVAKMAGQMLGLRIEGVKEDCSDAIAVALCRLEDQRSPLLGQ